MQNVIASSLAALIIGIPLGYWSGYSDGKEKQRTVKIEKIVQVKEKQREIRNNRPDARVVIERLRNGSFSSQADVPKYSKEDRIKAAVEMESGSCPVLTNIFMPDHQVMRDQSRVSRSHLYMYRSHISVNSACSFNSSCFIPFIRSERSEVEISPSRLLLIR